MSAEGDNEPLKAFYEKMKTDKLMQKPKFEHPVILRGNLLVHAHVLRLTKHLTSVRRTRQHHPSSCHTPSLFILSSFSYFISNYFFPFKLFFFILLRPLHFLLLPLLWLLPLLVLMFLLVFFFFLSYFFSFLFFLSSSSFSTIKFHFHFWSEHLSVCCIHRNCAVIWRPCLSRPPSL